jgi:histone-lysine N-methyltransferase SETMAR
MFTLSNIHKRLLILHCFNTGLDQAQTQQELQHGWGTQAPSSTTIYDWFQKFKTGNFDLEDAPREGRPITKTAPKNVNAVTQMVKENPHISCEEIGNLLGIAKGTASRILTEYLGLSKVNVKWVPHTLTEHQKSARLDFCFYFLNRFKESNKTSLYNIVTGDETWLYYYDPLDSKQAQQWHPKGAPPPKKAKRALSTKKVLITTFFSMKGIIHTEVLDEKSTVSST